MTLTLLLLLPLLTISHAALVPRIVGGRDATPGEIPYQVSFQLRASEHHFCGGVILDEHYVLTAAHCVSGKNIDLYMASVGTTDLRVPYSVHLIESSYVHKEYNRENSWINDIALVKVKTPFKFSVFVSPVVLPEQDEDVKAGTVATVSGYGRLWHDGPRTKELHIANIKIANQDYCRFKYEEQSMNIFDTQICANEPSQETGSCKGDSGGPLTVDGKLMGLVSWSNRCADTTFPSVYTRVPSYIDWIKEHAI